MLDLAVLGLLHESPMHGYELRKRLTTMLGPFRAAISYGTLYPTLRRMQQAGWITEDSAPVESATAVGAERPLRRKPGFGKRSRISYKLTAEGKERFGDLLAQVGPEAYDDAAFGVHFAFFGRTDAATRLRILEGRRRRVEERREGLRDALNRAAERLDAYSLELQRHGLEAADREVRWLEELIVHERAGQPPTVTTPHPSPGAADSNTTGPDRSAGEGRPG